jgi:hypothetical protein
LDQLAVLRPKAKGLARSRRSARVMWMPAPTETWSRMTAAAPASAAVTVFGS